MKKIKNDSLKHLAFSKILMMIAVFFLVSSCKKESSCYDEQLYQQNKDKVCTADCPGVIGCDGKSYCNECEANRHGIRVK